MNVYAAYFQPFRTIKMLDSQDRNQDRHQDTRFRTDIRTLNSGLTSGHSTQDRRQDIQLRTTTKDIRTDVRTFNSGQTTKKRHQDIQHQDGLTKQEAVQPEGSLCAALRNSDGQAVTDPSAWAMVGQEF